MKGEKTWARRKKRGDIRWTRMSPYLAFQWKGNKVVTMLTRIHNSNAQVVVKLKGKHNDKWLSVNLKQLNVIQIYHAYMNGVDKSDQILSTNDSLRKCVCPQETLFYG